MHIAVIGVGHVGLVTAGALARWGHTVVGMDHDTDKVATLLDQQLPFHEPGLDEMIHEGVDAGRLRFTDDFADALGGATVAFVCVGTPAREDGSPNLSYVQAVAEAAAICATGELVLVEKSTVPADTGRRLRETVERIRRTTPGPDIHIASNPEFLREGTAVDDTLTPDRVVLGTDTDWAAAQLDAVYAPIVTTQHTPVVHTDVPTAELIKHASNAFLATRISFINAVAQICERVGADVEQVADGMGLDRRIGRAFLAAGLGYGGSCFPKDVDGFAHLAIQVGYRFGLLDEVRAINIGQRQWVLDQLTDQLWHLDGKTVTLLGAAFKPGTDDLREAPAMWLANQLRHAGAHVRIWDPVALDQVARQAPWLDRYDDVADALDGADAAVIATDWPELADIRPQTYADRMANPLLIDGRNLLDGPRYAAAGITYIPVGRPRPTPTSP